MPDVILENGDLPALCRLSSGVEHILQRVEIRIRTVYGEWFLDKSVGIPWPEWLSDPAVSLDVISARLRAEVESTPGVSAVTTWSATRSGRAISIEATFRVDTSEEDYSIPMSVTLSHGNSSVNVLWWRHAR